MSDRATDTSGLLEAALAELDREEVGYSYRKRRWDRSAPPPEEIDFLVQPGCGGRMGAALERSGFHALKTRGHDGHRFYLAEAGGRWLKIDVKLDRARTMPLRRLRRRIPLAAKRQGPVVAVLGPDGAGKGTVIELLERQIPIHVAVVYLGFRRRRRGIPGAGAARRLPPPPLELAFVLKGFARSLRILLGAYGRAWRGSIVLCDRHPVEGLAIPPPRSRPAAALERLLLRRLLPRPDAIILLDAPGETLFARKREHSAATLEQWRQAYFETFTGDHVTVVSTLAEPELAAQRASDAVWKALAGRRGWT